MNLVKKVPLLPFGNIKNKRSMVYVGNLCHLIDELIKQKQNGIFLASDDEPLSTTKLIELIAKNLETKVTLIKVPFFETFLKLVKPSFYKRLYGSLEVDNTLTKQKLSLKNPYSGRMRRSRKPLSVLRWTGGSNPPLSAPIKNRIEQTAVIQ